LQSLRFGNVYGPKNRTNPFTQAEIDKAKEKEGNPEGPHEVHSLQFNNAIATQDYLIVGKGNLRKLTLAKRYGNSDDAAEFLDDLLGQAKDINVLA